MGTNKQFTGTKVPPLSGEGTVGPCFRRTQLNRKDGVCLGRSGGRRIERVFQGQGTDKDPKSNGRFS